MKAKLNTTTKSALIAALALLLLSGIGRASEPHESGAGKVCGTLRSFEGETQVFDYTRTHLGDASFGTKLHCGDWVSVEKGKAVLEHVAGAGMLVAEDTFVQILDPQSGDNPDRAHVALYRGEFLAQPTKAEFRILTPNSLGRVEKGAAFVLYSTASEETQIVGLGGATTLQNRFFGEKRMVAGFAKVVTFANPVERLLPDQARFVSARDLNSRLASLGVPAAVRESVEKAVKAGTKTKMPVSLASVARKGRDDAGTIKVRADGELASAAHGEDGAGPNRAPASLAKPVAVAGPKRPARKRVASDEPDFALKRANSDEQERNRLLQALSTMRPEDSESP